MWGIATSTGAGMAIAGITATYYALASRNHRGEQERMAHENGGGDGLDVQNQVEDKEDEKEPPPTPPSKVVKKGIDELSFLSGSTSGFNVLYSPNSLDKSQKSTFAMTPIISRAAIETSREFLLSEEEISTLELEPTAEVEENALALAVENEQFETEETTEDPGEVPVPATPESNEKEETPPKPSAVSNPSVGQKWKSAQEFEALQRTTSSPICVFKNPDFGTKYSFKTKQEEPPVLTIVSQLQTQSEMDMNQMSLDIDTNEERGPVEAVSSSCPHTEDNDSTQFILSPSLPQSNVSVFDKDTTEKLLGDGDNNIIASDLVPPRSSFVCDGEKPKKRRLMTTLRKRRSEHRSKNRIRIRADPGIHKLRQVLRRSKKPPQEQVPAPDVKEIQPKDKYDNIIITKAEGKIPPIELWEKSLEENDKRFYENLRDHQDVLEGGVTEEPLLVPSTISISKIKLIGSSTPEAIENAPAALSSIPVRVYRTSIGTMPWTVFVICALVVVFAGFIGVFLVKLSNEVIDSKGFL